MFTIFYCRITCHSQIIQAKELAIEQKRLKVNFSFNHALKSNLQLLADVLITIFNAMSFQVNAIARSFRLRERSIFNRQLYAYAKLSFQKPEVFSFGYYDLQGFQITFVFLDEFCRSLTKFIGKEFELLIAAKIPLAP